MNRITFRFGVALLTFVVGVAAVSLWFFLKGDYREKKSESIQIVNQVKSENEVKSESNIWEYSKTPKVKWVYIQTEEKHIEEWLTETADDSLRYTRDVLIFYENGVWSRVWITLTRENNQWKIVEISDGFMFLGMWNTFKKEALKIKVEKCQCSNEDIPTDGGTKLHYPFIEKWLLENTLGERESILTNKFGTTYRLLNRNELSKDNLEELFSAPFSISDKKSIRFRKCLDEDIRY